MTRRRVCVRVQFVMLFMWSTLAVALIILWLEFGLKMSDVSASSPLVVVVCVRVCVGVYVCSYA